MMQTPRTLKTRCARAARLALTPVPTLAIWAVNVVPMLSPKTMGIVCTKLMAPVEARIWTMAMVALELWMAIVIAVPMARPSSGWLAILAMMSRAATLLPTGSKASFMKDRPRNSNPNPIRTEPKCFHSRLPSRLTAKPTPMAGRA